MIHSRKTDWKRLKKMNDDEIDYSDIPKTDENFWADAEIVYPKEKVKFTVQLDEDIVKWLKQFGVAYHQTVNNILRSYFMTFKQLKNSKNK